MNLRISKEKLYILYYSILLVLMFVMMRPNSDVSTAIRVIMFSLTFIPVIFKLELLPSVFVCFYGTSAASFSPIVPTMPSYYIILIPLLYLVYNRNRKSRFCIKSLTVYAFYLICSLIHVDIPECFSWLFVCILLGDMIKKENDLRMLFYAFLIVSIFLSLLYIVNRSVFVYQYGVHTLGLEHSGWINQNFFGAFISAGGVLAGSYITGFLRFVRSRFLTIICIIVMILSFLVLGLNSSRGALFSFAIPVILMILTSKIKLHIKLIVVSIIVIAAVLMFNNNIFDLLLYRLQDDTFETGGGRTTIWSRKLESFINESNPLTLLFGVGRTATNTIGGINISTHNDIVTSFIGFGIIGLLLFIYYILLYPMIIANKSAKLFICILSIYTLVECMVLEPFFRGYVIVIMFYIFTLRYCIIQKNSHKFE